MDLTHAVAVSHSLPRWCPDFPPRSTPSFNNQFLCSEAVRGNCQKIVSRSSDEQKEVITKRRSMFGENVCLPGNGDYCREKRESYKLHVASYKKGGAITLFNRGVQRGFAASEQFK